MTRHPALCGAAASRPFCLAPLTSAWYQTTALNEGLVCDGGSTATSCTVGGSTMPGGLPAPNVDCFGNPQPETGMIVKFNPAHNAWEDQLGRNWNNAVRFSLLDEDVFVINAAGSPPAEVGVPYAGVGTILFDMVTNPVTGKVYVSNTEARNEVRFEGSGTCPTTPGRTRPSGATSTRPASRSSTARASSRVI